jgi:hypothetical protein
MSTKSDRPNRLVVALGIATIVLFSANLLSMISQRVWPKLQDLSIFGNQDRIEEVSPEMERRIEIYRRDSGPSVYTFQHSSKHKKHRRYVHRSQSSSDDFERSLESDMNRLEREIEQEMERLNSELSDNRTDLEQAVRLKLRLNRDNSVLVERQKVNLEKLEARISDITREFEVRVKEHEAAARGSNQ